MNTQIREHMKAAIFAIDRLRMGTDGQGLTTLFCFMSCPLRCAYCLNDRCHANIEDRNDQSDRSDFRNITPRTLYETVKIDNLYFSRQSRFQFSLSFLNFCMYKISLLYPKRIVSETVLDKVYALIL